MYRGCFLHHLTMKKRRKCSQLILKAFKMKVCKMNEHRKTTIICELTFFVFQNGMKPCPEFLEMTTERVKGSLETWDFLYLICSQMISMASFLMRDLWNRNPLVFVYNTFLSGTCSSPEEPPTNSEKQAGPPRGASCLLYGSLVSIAPGSKLSSFKKMKRLD